MCKSIALALLAALTALAALVAPPATQPSSYDASRAASLVHQLEDPVFKKREEAATALENMGLPVVPLLEEAAGSASFESKARIEAILRALREPLRGVIVCKLAPEGQAVGLGIRAGDVITHVENRPIRDYVEFEKTGTRFEKQERTLTIRSKRERRTVTVQPGLIGVWIGDYDDRYGQPLIAAVQAFEQERMVEARDRLKAAREAGMTFRARDSRQIMYALATYFAGEPAAARAMLDDWAARSKHPWPWADLCNLLPKYHSSCHHLLLFTCNKYLATTPGNSQWNLYQAEQLCGLGRCPEGIIRALDTASGQPGERSDDDRIAEFKALCTGFRNFGLEPELLQVISANAGRNLSKEWMAASSVSAEALGRPDIALKLDTELFRGQATDMYRSAAAAQIIHLDLKTGQEAKATALIESLTPEEAAKVLPWVCFFRYRWPEARPVLAELARLALRHDKVSGPVLRDALVTLAMQATPNLAELDSIFARIRVAPASRPTTLPDEYEASDHIIIASRTLLAMVRGEYDAAEELVSQVNPKSEVPESIRTAISFVKEHRAALTGDREPWCRTMSAHSLKTGGYLLYTRDQRLGYASPDATSIRDIPPPQKRWSSLARMDAILNTHGENGILSTCGDTIYLLDEARSGWVPLARLPEHYTWWNLQALSASFDKLIPLLRADAEGPVRIVEPDTLFTTGTRMISLMLSDGRWLSCDTRSGAVRQPRQIASQTLGEQVDIYAVLNPARDKEDAFVYTSKGLLEWRPEDGTMRRISLPGVDKPLPVTPTYEGAWPPEGTLRVALFPEAGGTTFLIETATGHVRREGCINESCPLSFWRQKSPEWKRELLSKAVRDANLTYPWAASQPAID